MDATVTITLSVTILVLAVALVIVVTSWATSLRDPAKIQVAIDRLKLSSDSLKKSVAQNTPK